MNYLLPLTITLVLINLALAGCTPASKDSILPLDGPSMQEIYAGHIEGMSEPGPQYVRGKPRRREVQNGEASLHGYTRMAANEIEALFDRLPNPILVMYVYPHLSSVTGAPVPGYATTFPMYERVEYALPGEVQSRSAKPAH